jgi:hypothetical protein
MKVIDTAKIMAARTQFLPCPHERAITLSYQFDLTDAFDQASELSR